MQKANEEVPQDIKAIFRDAYIFYARHRAPQNTVKWWNDTAEEMRIVCERHKNSKLCVEMLVGIYIAIEDSIRMGEYAK